MKIRGDLAKAALCLLLVFSPVGAPTIGLFIQEACPVDPTVHPHGMLAPNISYCGISRPVEQIYQASVPLSFLPVVFLGRLLGGFLTIMWWLSGIAVAARCACHSWRVIAKATVERV